MDMLSVTKRRITASVITLLAVIILLVPGMASAQEDQGPFAPPPSPQPEQQVDQQPGGITNSDQRQPDIQESLCAGANFDVAGGCQTDDEDGQSPNEVLNDLVSDIVNLFSWVVGIVAVIMIIVGGFRYITSGGDSTNVGNAKNTIMYAIIGLVIVALSQWIVRFVLGRVVA